MQCERCGRETETAGEHLCNHCLLEQAEQDRAEEPELERQLVQMSNAPRTGCGSPTMMLLVLAVAAIMLRR